MLKEYASFWKNLLNFKGRARRREYWVAYLWVAITGVLVAIPCLAGMFFAIDIENNGLKDGAGVIVYIVCMAIALIWGIVANIGLISLSVRRCHDIGFSGWYYLLCGLGSLLCGIGGIVWLVFCCLDSKEDNKWGENPKKPETNQYNGAGSIILASVLCIVSYIVFMVFYFVFLIGIIRSVESSGVQEMPNSYEELMDDLDLEDYEY